MGKLRRLIEEKILNDHTCHGTEGLFDVLRVGIRLCDVFPLDVQAHEAASTGFVEHVGDTKTRLRVELNVPMFTEKFSRFDIADGSVSG